VGTDDPAPRLIHAADAETSGLTVADAMHAGVPSMPPTVTAGELRAWFAGGRSRRLALIDDGAGRYAGSLTPAELDPRAPDEQPALDFAVQRTTLDPGMPAAQGRDLVIASDGRRLPVVDAAGRLLGVLAMTTDLQYFACRPG
jgi:hypothetical protein